MARALELATKGRGYVEPNPMVGCLIVRDGHELAAGYHRQFGGPHAEIDALTQIANEDLARATLYVTLEPCCHHGKTPPCTQAIIASGIRRVVAAVEDPSARISGQGLAELRRAGIECLCGCLANQATELNAPYFQLVRTGIPWFIAKWAMSLDGRTTSDDERWVSNERSRAEGHRLRGRMDAILIGRRTLEVDDPKLTARPPGPRTASRIVLASAGFDARQGQILSDPLDPRTIIVVDPDRCPPERITAMSDWGCQVAAVPNLNSPGGLRQLATELGKQGMTNILVEGGPTILQSFSQADLLNEYHVFLAPKYFGASMQTVSVSTHGTDVHWHLRRPRK